MIDDGGKICMYVYKNFGDFKRFEDVKVMFFYMVVIFFLCNWKVFF